MRDPALARSGASQQIDTPCIAVCVLDEATGLCTGCGRSLAEIATWGALSASERRRVMATLRERNEARRAVGGRKVEG